MYKIVSLLLGIGVVGVITGGLAGAGVVFLAPLAGVTGASVTTAAYLAAPAAGFLGLMLDAKYGVSSKVQERIWTKERDDAQRLFAQGDLDYVGALEKAINASYELSQPAIYLFRPFAGSQSAKKNREDKLWVVENVLHRVKRDIGLDQNTPLSKWENVTQELVDSLRQVRPEEGILRRSSRWLRTKLFGDKSDTAQAVADRYLKLHKIKTIASILAEEEEGRLLNSTSELQLPIQNQAHRELERS